MTNKCKGCGREEYGYGSLLTKDGYCFDCSCRHRNELLEKIDVLEKKLDIAVKALDSLRGICFPQRAEEALDQIEDVK